MKKLFTSLIVGFASLLVLSGIPIAFVNAAYNDVTLTVDTDISIGGYTLDITGSSAAIESITANANDFSVVLKSDSSIAISSADRKVIVVTTSGGATYTETKTCTGSVSTDTLSASEDVTLTVSLESGTCTDTSSTATASSGGGGTIVGSIVNSAPSRSQTVYPDGTVVYHDTPVTVVPSTGTVTVPPVATLAVSLPSVVFTKTLKLGMTNDDVRRLQEILKTMPDIYPAGTVSGYFGPLTQKAIQAFQAKYGIVSSGTPATTGYGSFGPVTRQKLQEVFGGNSSLMLPSQMQPVVTPSEIPSSSITRTLKSGAVHKDVKLLQKILNTDPETQIAASGPGSPGNETTLFGAMTRKAVEKFQIKYEIAKTGEAGFGTVGPKTLKKLNDLLR